MREAHPSRTLLETEQCYCYPTLLSYITMFLQKGKARLRWDFWLPYLNMCLHPPISLNPDNLSHEATFPTPYIHSAPSKQGNASNVHTRPHARFTNSQRNGMVWYGAVRMQSVDVVHIHSFLPSLPKIHAHSTPYHTPHNVPQPRAAQSPSLALMG